MIRCSIHLRLVESFGEIEGIFDSYLSHEQQRAGDDGAAGRNADSTIVAAA